MNPRGTPELPTQAYSALVAYLDESGSDADPGEVAAVAIADWIERERKRAAAKVGAPGGGRGYQWKDLFLPDGTRLRMWYGTKFHYAEVRGDDLVFEGRSVSPARMANAVAGGTRNAWRDLWLLFPGETRWRLASWRRRQAQQIEKQVEAQRAAQIAAGSTAAAARPPGAMPAAGTPPVVGPHPFAGLPQFAGAVAPAQPHSAQPHSAQPNSNSSDLRRLADLLEQALTLRQQPPYRRRTDDLGDIPFDNGTARP